MEVKARARGIAHGKGKGEIMPLLIVRVLIISSLMISSSIALTGVGYAGAEGVGIILIHLIYAFLIDKVIRQRNDAQRKHAALTVALDAAQKNAEKAKQESLQHQVNYQLARDRIIELENIINTQQWARAKTEEYNRHQGDARAYRPHNVNGAANDGVRRQREHARKLLNIPRTTVLTRSVVNKAYAEAVKKDHPDHGGDGDKIHLYKQSKRILLESIK